MNSFSVHNGAQMGQKNQVVKKLPSYSPFLNPIEEAFNILKAAIKSRLNDRDVHHNLLNVVLLYQKKCQSADLQTADS